MGLPKTVKRCGTDFPRRFCTDLDSRTEAKLREALRAIEELGAHQLLTDAIVLVGMAKDKVSDFLELDQGK